jgi:hypothetical protein
LAPGNQAFDQDKKAPINQTAVAHQQEVPVIAFVREPHRMLALNRYCDNNQCDY